MVERRSSEVSLLSTQLCDDGPVDHALSVHLPRAKLIARSTIYMPRRNFLSPEFREKFQREVPLFCRYMNFLETQCSTGRKKNNFSATVGETFKRFADFGL